MAENSKIEWTEATWNPTVGCSIVSPGCTNCYAMKVAHGLEQRFGSKKYAGLTKVVNGNPVWTGEVRLDETALLQPLKWKRGRRVFVNSMSDLFHESLPDEAIDMVFAVMVLCPQHTFQVLTKRAERMRSYLSERCAGGRHIWAAGKLIEMPRGQHKPDSTWPLHNVWLGTSAERQQEADERIPLLLQTPAAVRFISAEPLLGPIDLTDCCNGHYFFDTLRGERWHDDPDGPNPREKYCAGLGWVIVGGESGRKARPMHPKWARSIRDQCAAAGVPFFFKQHGQFVPSSCAAWDHQGAHTSQTFGAPSVKMDGETFWSVGKGKAGRLLDGRAHDEFPVAA